MAKHFEAAIVQGYSTEISFRAFSSQGNEVTLRDIDWYSSLRRYQQTRREGMRFPLRTPDFNITERGLELLTTPAPERYAELHAFYRLDQLAEALAQIGPELWKIPELPTGDAALPGVRQQFPKEFPKADLLQRAVPKARQEPTMARERSGKSTAGASAVLEGNVSGSEVAAGPRIN